MWIPTKALQRRWHLKHVLKRKQVFPEEKKREGIPNRRNNICKTKEVCVGLFCWGIPEQFWKESGVCLREIWQEAELETSLGIRFLKSLKFQAQMLVPHSVGPGQP